MGYSTDFTGSLKLNRQATPDELKYIQTFSETRRMKRDPEKLQKLYKGKHGLNGNYGPDGAYFCFDDGHSGQNEDGTIIDYNTIPGQNVSSGANFMKVYAGNEKLTREGKCQPSLWCDWTLNDDGTELMWNGGEKFYNYIEWLEYMIVHFFEPWGIKLNGVIEWQGEESGDMGQIHVKNSVVTAKYARITYE